MTRLSRVAEGVRQMVTGRVPMRAFEVHENTLRWAFPGQKVPQILESIAAELTAVGLPPGSYSFAVTSRPGLGSQVRFSLPE